LWNGSGVPDGHGVLGLGHRPHIQPCYAHRIAWTLANGEIPAGVAVLHRCDVPRCVNPHHLFLGSQGDNVRDASRKGHLHVPRKRNRAIKQAAIIRYLAGGVTAAQVGAEFGVHFMTILRWTADQRPKFAKLHRKAS
jgi:HNH endonuclease